MQVNFVEANPVPVKAAMAAMGLLDEVVPPADVFAETGVEAENRSGPPGARSAEGCARLTRVRLTFFAREETIQRDSTKPSAEAVKADHYRQQLH